MLRNFLYKIWYSPKHKFSFIQKLAYYILYPLSKIYSLIISIKKYLYKTNFLKSYQSPIPIVVIGNIISGGAGKTPIVIELANQLKKSIKIGIVSRGYGAKIDKPIIINDSHTYTQVGDEPLLIYQKTKLPICVYPDRAMAIQYLLQNNPKIQLILSDDGLQHLKMQRDIECVVFNKHGTGNDAMLPAGSLRENIRKWDYTLYPDNLDNINSILLKSSSKGFRVIRQTKYIYKFNNPYTIEEISSFAGKTAYLLAGVANTDSIVEILNKEGIKVIVKDIADHGIITHKDFLKNVKADFVVITEKDMVKTTSNFENWTSLPIWVLTLKVGLPQAFIDDIIEVAHNTKIKK